MIGADGKKILPVYGDMRPVEVRKNNVRMAGWVEESKSGESVDFENTYNDVAEVLVHGNSVQDGEPTPDNPIPVLSAGDCNLVSRGKNLFNTNALGSISTPYQPYYRAETFLPILRKIGDVADTYNPVTGEYVQRIGVWVADGTEGWAFRYTRDSLYRYSVSRELLPYAINAKLFCTHGALPAVDAYNTQFYGEGVQLYHTSSTIVYFTTLIADVSDLKAFLAAQYAAGTPVEVYYQLAEPIVTYLAPAQVPTYYPWTRLEQDGAVKGAIEATVKVME